MVKDNELSNDFNNVSNVKNIGVLNAYKVKDFILVALENGQKVLTNGRESYDVSSYHYVSDLFNMGDKFCAVMADDYYTLYLVDLKANEILYKNMNAYSIHKQDDRTLYVIKKIGNSAIYNIETKAYLPSPKNYEFEDYLGNSLYVFREECDSKTDFYDYKRCVINAEGKIILNDIYGWLSLGDNYLIITKKEELCVIKINEDFSLEENTIKQNEKIIAKPKYHDGYILIMEKGLVKLLKPSLDLIKQYEIDELESVVDFEIVRDTLKLCLPYEIDEKRSGKHLFLNLKTGKSISHLRIEQYPYWIPETYIGKDDFNDEIGSFEYDKVYPQTKYHFYDSDFNKIADIKGNYYSYINADNGHAFLVGTFDGKQFKNKFINTQTGDVKDCNYEFINFSCNNPYGHAINTETDMIDIVDEDLNVVIPNIDYKRLGLYKDGGNFGYSVVNDYACIVKSSSNVPRSIIQNASGEIVLDSTNGCHCSVLGDLIQITKDGQSEYLNTLTGEIGPLSITALTDKDGKVDLSKISNFESVFKIGNSEELLLPSSNEQSQKIKMLNK